MGSGKRKKSYLKEKKIKCVFCKEFFETKIILKISKNFESVFLKYFYTFYCENLLF